ncbi:MAG: ABC transporter substrate-binding protein [Chloroflexi bacterium]|nr:ABC transporter substrate-binding protein [Chloroflexota bacterium]
MRLPHVGSVSALLILLIACAPAGAPPAATSAPATPATVTTASGAPAGEPQRLDMAIISGAGYYIPAYLATDRGFLEQEGIQGEWVVAGTPESVRAVVSGSVPIGMLGSDPCIVAVTKGAPLRQVAALLQRPTYDLMAAEGVRSIPDLRGQEIAVSSVASGTAVLARVFLEAKGLRRGEYELVAAGGNVERIAALQSGRVGAAVLSDPGNFVVMEQGYNHLGNIMEIIPEYDFSAWWVNTNWLQQGNEELLVRFLRAQVRARRFLDDPANRESVEAVLRERLRVSPAIAARIYDFYTRETPDALARDLQLNERATTRTIEIVGELGELTAPYPPASQFLAPEYLQRALRELGS